LARRVPRAPARALHHRSLSPNSLEAFELHALADISWWADRSLSEIDLLAVDEWARWLASKRKLSPKSIKNALGAFRTFLRWLRRMERLDRVPEFPVVHVPDHSPTIISPRTQALVLAEIPHERRGVFFALCHGVRPGEARALDLGDFQERDGVAGLLVRKAMTGRAASAPRLGTKTGDASWVPIDDELLEWIGWRLDQRGGVWDAPALFPNPGQRRRENPDRRWTPRAASPRSGRLPATWSASA
jgi:integrase